MTEFPPHTTRDWSVNWLYGSYKKGASHPMSEEEYTVSVMERKEFDVLALGSLQGTHTLWLVGRRYLRKTHVAFNNKILSTLESMIHCSVSPTFFNIG